MPPSPGSTFECALNGAHFACTSPKASSTLADGGYQFQVRATDPATNTEPSPAVRYYGGASERPRGGPVGVPRPGQGQGRLHLHRPGAAESRPVALTQILPAGATIVSVAPGAGACTSGPSTSTGTCSLPTLPAGGTATETVLNLANNVASVFHERSVGKRRRRP